MTFKALAEAKKFYRMIGGTDEEVERWSALSSAKSFVISVSSLRSPPGERMDCRGAAQATVVGGPGINLQS